MKQFYKLFFALLISAISLNVSAQVSITAGNHNVEISGAISAYYNQRFLKPTFSDYKKNRFKLRDAQIQIEGRYKNNIEYEFQFDIADLALGGNSIDPENPGLMDAYVTFKYIPNLDITAGYGKTPYSRSSMVAFINTPFWQRAELVRGDIFSRRDVGITLNSNFWKQRINLYAGIYTGMGELTLRGDNDPSGRPEYMGRVEFAFPARYRYQDIDTKVSPVPMFVVGGNVRYVNKTQQAGSSLPANSQGEYLVKIIDGKKTGFGGDASFQYMGFSAQFEIHQFILRPSNPNSFLFQGTDPDFNKGYVRVGGYYSQLNYFSKKFNSIVSARYESLNINDLAEGRLERLSIAYAYQIKGFNAMIKAQYFHNLNEETQIDPLSWNDQFRIGFQYLFK